MNPQTAAELRRHMHALAQPLSALCIAIELDTEDRAGSGLVRTFELRGECERAVKAFEDLRAALHTAIRNDNLEGGRA